MNRAPRRVGIMLGFGFSPADWRRRFLAGEVADETPYAYHLAADWFTLSFSSDKHEAALERWWRLVVRRILGFDLVHVWRNRRMLQGVDAVWTHTEREHLAVALLTALAPRRYRALSVAQSVWLWDLWPTFSGPRKAFFARLLRTHAVEIVLSSVNRDVSRRTVGGRTVLRLPFGTRYATAASADSSPVTPPRVLVVGNDRHRDWDLLVEVATRMPEAQFDLITLSHEVRSRPWPANVVARSAVQKQVLDAYAVSSIVALPLRDNRHASGCTVAIEAISAGVPLVVSDAGGIYDYVVGADATLVPVGDVDAFVHALRARLALRTEDHQRSSVATARGMSETDYITRLALVTRAVLEGRHPDAVVEEFASPPAPPTTPSAERKEFVL